MCPTMVAACSCAPTLALQRSSNSPEVRRTHGRYFAHVLGLVAGKSVCAGKLYLSRRVSLFPGRHAGRQRWAGLTR